LLCYNSALQAPVYKVIDKTPTTPTSSEPVSDNLIEIRDLSFAYGQKLVLKDINLTAHRGQVIAIMGNSGCGKTTLLRLIGGALKPTSGSLRVDGVEMGQLEQDALYKLRRRMGMLFQFGALFTDMSVYENVAFQLREHTELPEEMIRDLVFMKLNAVGLRGAHDLMPSELSGGMARRVALARSIALDPMLIIYDEPFAGLDPISLGVTGNLIRRLTDTLGMTSIVVTHDVQESLKMVDYVYFVSEGVIVARGTPAEIKASDLPYVHQFVHGEENGPVPFHYPAPDYAADLGLTV
jgi:phospholipid/cholesterol/gamma-HCH transport system ATP-binding protein